MKPKMDKEEYEEMVEFIDFLAKTAVVFNNAALAAGVGKNRAWELTRAYLAAVIKGNGNTEREQNA